MAYPERLLTDDETVVRDFHPHWRVLIPAMLWVVLLIAAIVAIWQLINDNDAVAWILTGVATIVLLPAAGKSVINWYFTQYVLTTERIIVRTGVLSRSGTEIPLENINNVLFSQTVFERLLGFGDVLIESAGSQGQSRFTDIPDPERFQSEVYRVREERTIELGRHSASRATGGESAKPDHSPLGQLERLAQLRDQGALSEAEFQEKKAKLLGEI